MSNNSSEKESKDTINLHHGRLRKLLQALKEHGAEINIKLDPTGEARRTIYGDSQEAEYKLTDLLKTVWPEDDDNPLRASTYAINEYFRSDYEVVNRRPYQKQYNEAHYNLIIKITAFIPELDGIENWNYKQQLFFSGDRFQATNILAAFPEFRKLMILDFKKFARLLRENPKEFPYQYLVNYTAHRTHRYKAIEKSIFQYLKDSDQAAVSIIQQNLLNLVDDYIEQLEELEAKKINHDEPADGQIVENRLTFSELSDVDEIEITKADIQFLDSIGFQNGFAERDNWFDEYRFKKIDYWIKWLEESSLSTWPDFYLEHILLAYYELNNVCSHLFKLREEVFQQVGFKVHFSKDGFITSIVEQMVSLEKLAVVLSKYEYESIAFVDKLRSDGNLLLKPIGRLPHRLDKNDGYPNQLYYSRVEKLLWEYLLSRMCDSCQMAEKHVTDYSSPLSKPIT